MISTREGHKTRTEALLTYVAHMTRTSRCRCMEVTDRGSGTISRLLITFFYNHIILATLSKVIQAWLTPDLGIVHIEEMDGGSEFEESKNQTNKIGGWVLQLKLLPDYYPN